MLGALRFENSAWGYGLLENWFHFIFQSLKQKGAKHGYEAERNWKGEEDDGMKSYEAKEAEVKGGCDWQNITDLEYK